jgi:hypothetical protein
MHRLYTSALPFAVIPCSYMGLFTGFTSKTTNSMDMFCTMVGYTSIGIITGMTYPVSFPLLAGYVLYKK